MSVVATVRWLLGLSERVRVEPPPISEAVSSTEAAVRAAARVNDEAAMRAVHTSGQAISGETRQRVMLRNLMQDMDRSREK